MKGLDQLKESCKVLIDKEEDPIKTLAAANIIINLKIQEGTIPSELDILKAIRGLRKQAEQQLT